MGLWNLLMEEQEILLSNLFNLQLKLQQNHKKLLLYMLLQKLNKRLKVIWKDKNLTMTKKLKNSVKNLSIYKQKHALLNKLVKQLLRQKLLQKQKKLKLKLK